MAEKSGYAPGTPSWIDLGSLDFDASRKFYTALFGWQADTDPNPDAHGYTLFSLRGKNVAGMGPSPVGFPVWNSYVSVKSVDATLKLALEAGGAVMAEPMDVTDAGRMCVLADPAGAVLSLWEPRAHIGAELVNEPGALCWNELQTRDPAKSRAFLESTLGWKGRSEEGMPDYVTFTLGGEGIAGMMPMPAEVPKEVQSHWAVYIAVEDCEKTVQRAQDLGATIVSPPSQIPPGTMSVIADPQGAVFNVLQFAG